MQSDSDTDKLIIILCHLSVLLGVGVILPLIVYLWKKDGSPSVAEHAKEALNFHISLYIYGIISFILCFILIGFLMLAVLGVATLILAIVATIKASQGQLYRYPLTLRLVP